MVTKPCSSPYGAERRVERVDLAALGVAVVVDDHRDRRLAVVGGRHVLGVRPVLAAGGHGLGGVTRGGRPAPHRSRPTGAAATSSGATGAAVVVVTSDVGRGRGLVGGRVVATVVPAAGGEGEAGDEQDGEAAHQPICDRNWFMSK